MERFIVLSAENFKPSIIKFKIQYGEIYRIFVSVVASFNFKFKIQYGEIYRELYSAVKRGDISFKIQYGEIYSLINDFYYKFIK